MVGTMTRQIFLPLTFTRQFLAAALFCASCAAAPMAQEAAAPEHPSAKPSTYAVVSIRTHKDNGNGSRWWTTTADGYQARNLEPAQLILEAYGIQHSNQLVGLPDWAYQESFDIEARLDEDALPAYQKLSDPERIKDAAPRLRSMLAERFHLGVHHETRLLPVYDLVIAKGGFKVKQSQAPQSMHGMMEGRGRISILGGSIGDRFIVGLSDATGRIVIDKTGLTGWYDIDLKWTPDEDLAAGASGPTLFTAIEEQLGLKLVPSKAPVDVIVVDHIEQPSAN